MASRKAPEKPPALPTPPPTPLLATVSSDVTKLPIPRFVPSVALVIHRTQRDMTFMGQSRALMATVHGITERRGTWHLEPGRLLDRQEELTLADDLSNAEERAQHQPLFPPGLLQVDAASATWYIPASVRPMRIRAGDTTEVLNVPWPALVCHARGTNLDVVALNQDQHPSGATPIFHAPLGNVNQHGQMCLGNIPPPRGSPLESLPEWTRILLDTPFTHTNHNAAFKAPTGSTDNDKLLPFWRLQQAQTVFPQRALVSRKETLNEWLNKLRGVADDDDR